MAARNTPSEEKTISIKSELWVDVEHPEHLESETRKEGIVKKNEELDESYDSEKHGPQEMLYYRNSKQSSANIQKVQEAEVKLQDMASIENELKNCICHLKSVNATMERALSFVRKQKEERVGRMAEYTQMIPIKDETASVGYSFYCIKCTATFYDPDPAVEHFEKHEQEEKKVGRGK